jgi:16S rRNA (guanine966-N2)-methyltransferase
VRETLFNWLQPRIQGARVLDLFAGSGALGLEALSRGAADVTFIERDRRAAMAIETLLKEWQETGGRVACADALTWMPPTGTTYDVVFLDPPYDAALMLAERGCVSPDARIYVERRARDALPPLPEAWRELRSGQAGEVGYHHFSS